MSNSVLIMGESGTGKSTSIRTLDPKETYIINVLDKPLPFKSYKKDYRPGIGGNYFASDKASAIIEVIRKINEVRPEIKNVIIDDFQYIMAIEFMNRAMEKSYDKFTEIAMKAFSVIRETTLCREDLYFFILTHTDTDTQGKSKIKTIGKMLDDKVSLEGLFTIILHSFIVDGQFKFLTQNNGMSLAKSPIGMFDEKLIDNDLLYIKNKISEYNDIESEKLPTL